MIDALPLLFREHRGSLDKSMQTIMEIKSLEHLMTHIESIWDWEVPIIGLEIKKYVYDDRIGWDTYMAIMTIKYNDENQTFPIGFLNRKPEWID
jgi:hypothetical protein